MRITAISARPQYPKAATPARAHTKDCEWHLDQYDHECSCGATGPKGKPVTDTLTGLERELLEALRKSRWPHSCCCPWPWDKPRPDGSTDCGCGASEHNEWLDEIITRADSLAKRREQNDREGRG